MSIRFHPIAHTGFSGNDESLPLAGSRYVWFDEVGMDRDGVDEADFAAAQMRLSAPRPDICGLVLDRPRIMGILNVTPDSFSDGGDLTTIEAALIRAKGMQGTDILDIGGESTRPGAEEVSVTEEIRRTAPVIRAIRDAGIITPISIDTRKAAVAEAALAAGANMINDVSSFSFDPELADIAAKSDIPVCLMHAQGDPATMQKNPRYEDVLAEVYDYLAERVEVAKAAGIRAQNIIVDPGIGFGKTLQHNLILLRGLSLYHDLGLPVLLGVSRKKFIGTIGQADAPKDRMPGSLAVALHGAAMGAHILRVHDVKETRQALALWQAIHAEDEADE